MAQTIAEFLKFHKRGHHIRGHYVVYRMRNSEGLFWVSFTDEYLLNFSEEELKELEGKLVLLCGKWEGLKRKLDKWEGRKLTCEKSYLLLEGDFFVGSWEKKEKEVIPEKSLREME